MSLNLLQLLCFSQSEMHLCRLAYLHSESVDKIICRLQSVSAAVIRVSTAPGNTGNLLEFDIPPGNTGNLLKFNWSSWKIFMTRQRNFLHQVGLIAG